MSSCPWGDPVTPPTDSTTTPTSRVAELTLDKQSGEPVDANDSGRTDAGDTVVYRFTVTNTGAVSVHDLVVVDDLLAGLEITCPTTSLASGESTTCVAEPYTITQDDVDAGALDNVARVVGNTTPGDPDTQVSSPDDETSLPLPQEPGLTLEKSADLQDRDGDGKADEGERIRYSFVVTNTGNTVLTDVRVEDPMLERAGVEVNCDVTTLAPGESVTCVATYTVTAADAAKDEIANTASAVADSPTGEEVTSDDDTAVVPTDPAEGPPPPGDDGPLPDTGGPRFGLLLGGLVVLGTGIWLIAIGRLTSRGRTS